MCPAAAACPGPAGVLAARHRITPCHGRPGHLRRLRRCLSTHRHPPPPSPTFTLLPTTIDIVSHVIKTLDSTKATDIYNILPALIRNNHDILSPIITTNFNNSVKSGVYPSVLKVTRIAALYKAKDKTLPINYRPISLLPIIGKIFDTIINQQLMQHLLQHNILHPHQYAFRPQSDTTAALLSSTKSYNPKPKNTPQSPSLLT